MALRQYAYFANYVGPNAATASFPDAGAAGMGNAIESLCQTPLGGYIQGTDLHVGDLIDDTLRTTLLACVDSNGAGAGCVEPGKSYYAFLSNDVLTADRNGAPVLYVQGLLDEIMPAASEAACNLQKLAADGVVPELCVDPTADHLTIVHQNIAFAISWGEAILAGTPPPSCDPASLPVCIP
jgi:hypothetical protein